MKRLIEYKSEFHLSILFSKLITTINYNVMVYKKFFQYYLLIKY